MNRAIKYRVYPTTEQCILFAKTSRKLRGDFMGWLYDNWSLILVIIVVLVYFFLNGKQSVMNWLFYAVTQAERDFSESGLGKIKLKSVYDSFVITYPIFSKIIPFKVFSAWVDLALDEMRDLLSKNWNFWNYVKEFANKKEQNVENIQR